MQRTPQPNTNPKRRLDDEFEDGENNGSTSKQDGTLSTSKRQNPNELTGRSFNKFEAHMFAAEVQASMIKVANLEVDLKMEQNERKRMEIEFASYKEKQQAEMMSLNEAKQQLEVALKSSKTNEKLLNSEMDRLRSLSDEYERVSGPAKDNELAKYKTTIQQFEVEKKDLIATHEKEVADVKRDLGAKKQEIARLESDINVLKSYQASISELSVTLDASRKENCTLQNRIRDLEIENRALQDGKEQMLHSMDQSSQIEELQRENRKSKSEIEHLRACQEKAHLYQEEIAFKTKQIERYESKLVSVEFENGNLKDAVKQLNEQLRNSQSSAPIEKHKEIIKGLDADVRRMRDRCNTLEEEITSLKADRKQKENEIQELQKQVVRFNTERNGFKHIVDSFSAPSEQTIAFKGGLSVLDQMLNQYEQSRDPVSNEIKLSNNTVFRLEDCHKRNAQTQVNLNHEIYSDYEQQIDKLKAELEAKRARCASLEKQLEGGGARDTPSSALNETIEFINANSMIEKLTNENVMLKELIVRKEEEMNESRRSEATRAEVKALEDELENERVIKQRLLKEFERKSTEIMRSCRHMLGFRVNFNDKSIRLTLPENRDQFLEFKINKDLSLSLIETTLAKTYSHFIDNFLKKYDSVAVFLNAIKLDINGFKIDITPK